MYLIDTNIWLERLLDQEKSEEVRKFLHSIPTEKLFITDFSFHSISIILTKLRKFEILVKFLYDVFIEGKVYLISLTPEDILKVISVMEKFKLDFDDAYQYVAAEKYDLIIISFDSDFDVTEKGRKTPAEILE
jgi:predicted nucleic acid-binding protein